MTHRWGLGGIGASQEPRIARPFSASSSATGIARSLGRLPRSVEHRARMPSHRLAEASGTGELPLESTQRHDNLGAAKPLWQWPEIRDVTKYGCTPRCPCDAVYVTHDKACSRDAIERSGTGVGVQTACSLRSPMGDHVTKSRARGASPAAQPSRSLLLCGAHGHPPPSLGPALRHAGDRRPPPARRVAALPGACGLGCSRRPARCPRRAGSPERSSSSRSFLACRAGRTPA